MKKTPSDALRRAQEAYEEKLDKIIIRVPKGKREAYKKAAEAEGKSMNQFIRDTLDDKINERR